jgi:acetylornithine/succinyldiaminopimelate/putrescine aminotransferase
VTALRERGVLASTAGTDTVRLTPPFIVTPEEVDVVAKAFAEAVQEVGR